MELVRGPGKFSGAIGFALNFLSFFSLFQDKEKNLLSGARLDVNREAKQKKEGKLKGH